ncbi:PhoX family protein [Cytobacillus oceanisediminis]|uniref:PhoX family protein n=1 Tax=Cytobacillus oceanisediminis TaxID=665099 RepID=UPI001C24DAB3|nr:alkaline phosphatase PhoX [Cytobacillus oceanisediminis]MBU8772099.1 DUF839 domain-containing protein [Cytobacillus oceanisediminis]
MKVEENKLNRRKFLTFIGTGTVALAAIATGVDKITENSISNKLSDFFGLEMDSSIDFFKEISPSLEDELILPEGYTYNVIAAYGDVINQSGDTFGFDCDYTVYFPIDGSNERGLLWVNHESSSEIFVHGIKKNGRYTHEQIYKILYNQGGSLIEIYLDNDGIWKMDTHSKFARRVTGFTPMDLTGPAKGSPAVKGALCVQGTFTNCAGGKTLWNTVLSCEENFEETAPLVGLEPTHYGWVIEVDPFDDTFQVKKHTALGRFHHENAVMGLTRDSKVVVYSGDDLIGGCIYKYISTETYQENLGRKNSRLLEDGKLYAADLQNGEWLELTIENVRNALNKETFNVPKQIQATKDQLLNAYQTQADVLVYAHYAALIIGATPTDRPEDIEISPFDNSIFIAHTNNPETGNTHGHITRIFEKGEDLGASKFEYEIFLAGGKESGLSSPDNLLIDSKGNLWIVTDISGSKINQGEHKSFGNNGMFIVPTTGSKKGQAHQFASAPIEAELTGPWFTPNEKTLFLAVQHPGEETKEINNPTSMWPHREGDLIPRPAVVAIQGFKKLNK